MLSNQEIVCDGCGEKFGLDELPSLHRYGMICPQCKAAHCHVVNLSRKYAAVIKAVDENLLLPGAELGILQTLQAEQRPLFAGEIAAELDCSYQLVGKRGKTLAERGMVERSENEQGRRQFEITETASCRYFRSESDDSLDVS